MDTLVTGTAKASVVVVGGANLDIQGMSFARFVGADSNPGIIERSAGGVGRNIAENLARLGMEVSLISVFGDSEEGLSLLEGCRRSGIEVSQSLIVSDRAPTYLAIVDRTGALVGAVADMGAMDRLTPEQLEKRVSILDSAAFLVVDTNVPKESLRWLVDRYGRREWRQRHGDCGCRVAGAWTADRAPLLVLDPVSCAKAGRAAGMLGAFTLAKPNRAECGILAGNEGEYPARLCAVLRQKGELPGELYISMGEQGIYCCPETGDPALVKLPPPSLCPAPVNRSGAGDAALAALVWATARGVSPEEKARYALTASALTAASKDPVNKDLSEAGLLSEKARMFDFSGA